MIKENEIKTVEETTSENTDTETPDTSKNTEYDVEFVGMEIRPVKNDGTFSHPGPREDALKEFERTLDEAYKKMKENYLAEKELFRVLKFEETKQTSLILDPKTLN